MWGDYYVQRGRLMALRRGARAAGDRFTLARHMEAPLPALESAA
jgi:hypothetical protein